jgi:hypothetical protein
MVLKFSTFLKIKVSYYSSKYKQYLCHLRDSHAPLIGRDKWRRERSSLPLKEVKFLKSSGNSGIGLIHRSTGIHLIRKE